MSLPLIVNGVTYNYPQVDDVDYGPDATDWASAVTTGMLQKAGGLFQLLAETDFGTSFGIKSLYYKSRTANPASAGQIRLARADVISWRNQANNANLDLAVNSSDILTFNGSSIQNQISVSDTSTIDLTLLADTLSADIITGSITNSLINASAAIAFSKLASLTSAHILVGSAGNVATDVAVSGDVSLSNAGVTAIGANKVVNSMLAQMAQSTFKGRAASSGTGDPVDLTATQATAILNNFVGDSGIGGTKGLVPAPVMGDATKFLAGDGTWSTPGGSGDVVGPGSATDGGFAKFDGTTGKLLKNSAATIANADVASAAAIAVNKLAALTASRAVVTDGSGFISAATTTATEIGYVNGVTSSIQTQLNALARVAPTIQKFTATGSQTGWLFTISTSSTLAIGDTYTNNGNTYTALNALSAQSGAVLWMSGTGATSGTTLTRATGVGTASITFSTKVAIATYTTPTSPAPLYIRVVMVGGGGGGAADSASGNAGTDGKNTTFGALLLNAGKGGRGGSGGNTDGGIPTSSSLGTGPIGVAYPGNPGASATGIATGNAGNGGSSFFGGAGQGWANGTSQGSATNAETNSGSGGGGATPTSGTSHVGGGGGASGGFVDAIITSPAATYPYAVGTGGSGGSSTDQAGANGADGIILVYGYYQ